MLELTEYERVLYLDADVMPLCNLDYVLELSLEGKHLAPNVVLGYTREPANGGFFVLQPSEGDFTLLQSIVAQQRQQAAAQQLPYPHFDVHQGWGHAIAANDSWVSSERSGRLWDFYGSYSDQGLLYHWVKYVKQDVSILILDGDHQRWGKAGGVDGKLPLLYQEVNPLLNHSCLGIEDIAAAKKDQRLRWALHPSHMTGLLGKVPHSDICHLYAHLKPWRAGWARPVIKSKEEALTCRHYWFHVMRQINAEYELGINFDRWYEEVNEKYRAPFGLGRVPDIQALHDAAANGTTALSVSSS